MSRAERAETELVGTVLLLGIVVLLVSVVGVAVLLTQSTDARPTADVNATVTADDLTVVHRGGESLAFGSVRVVVRADGGEFEGGIDGAGVAVGGGDGRFDPGERWTGSHGLGLSSGDRVRVFVVWESNVLLFDAERRVER